ncbi:hypothetical protein RclHR1_01780012 [Rhizophagus clarus]|uniref:Uncharacterized protein n=1 Tax=Rhizophagus clarus TaxID=94130 RepID=A0A2Z6QMD0_9GLOM|nr:hypothetical protein RclHR1_01780012 [Rhizophagus clarus]GES89850.1 hypothetical protein GLOIN_2v1709323 [Rhizophagus clarus]
MDQRNEYLSFVENYEQRTKQYTKPKEEEEPTTLTVQQDVTTFPAEIQRIRETLLETTKPLLYISESEEPYEFIFIPKEDITELPNDCVRFKSLIKQNGNNLMITEEELSSPESNSVLSFQEFFDPFTADFAEDPYGQKDGYKELQKIVEATFHGKENVKVYKIGDYRRVGVYLVGVIKGIGIAGLKTYSIET